MGDKRFHTIQTNKGRVHIESIFTLDQMRPLVLASGFTRHGPYTSILTKKEMLEFFVERGGHVCLSLLDHKTIVGFAVLDYPDEKERWARLGEKIIMELKAVEVVRELRNHTIARHLLTHLFSDTRLEEKIVCLSAYSWTWDLDYSGLSAASYRKMLISLYAGFGFVASVTNEPNICLKSENIFMVRVGKNVSCKIREKFKWLRFNVWF